MVVALAIVFPLSAVFATVTPPDIHETTSPLFLLSTTSPNAGTETTTIHRQLPGCPKCNTRRCPQSTRECSLNVGLVDDPCECCPGGVCGLREGAKCYSEAVASELHPEARALGPCGQGMECHLRTDLSHTDNPEALCTCIEVGLVCGTDNRTHPSSCHLSQESDSVWVKYPGPCRAAPWIVSPPDQEVSVPLGASVSLSCESKGYPTPRIHWERIDMTQPLYLPSDDSSVSVQLRGGPEPFMGSAWLQILATTTQHNGTFACIAVNSEGEARATTLLKITSNSFDPDA